MITEKIKNEIISSADFAFSFVAWFCIFQDVLPKEGGGSKINGVDKEKGKRKKEQRMNTQINK